MKDKKNLFYYSLKSIENSLNAHFKIFKIIVHILFRVDFDFYIFDFYVLAM